MAGSLSNAKFTTEGSDKVLKVLQSMEKHMEKVAKATKRVGKNTKKGNEETKKLGRSFQQIRLAALISNARTLVNLMKQASKHLKDGAFAFDMNQRAAVLTKTTLVDFKQVSDSLKGTIPLTELQQMVNMANNLKLNMTDMAKVGNLASNIAAQSGRETKEVMEAMIRAFATGRVMTLQNMGVTVDARLAYVQFAKAANISIQSMTQLQKQQAILNNVIANNPDLMQKMGSTMTQNIAQMKTDWMNFVSDMQEALAKRLMPMLTDLANFWTNHRRIIKSGPMVVLEKLKIGTEEYAAALAKQISAAESARDSAEKMLGPLRRRLKIIDEQINAQSKMDARMRAQMMTNVGLFDKQAALNKKIAEYSKHLKSATTDLKALNRAQEKQNQLQADALLTRLGIFGFQKKETTTKRGKRGGSRLTLKAGSHLTGQDTTTPGLAHTKLPGFNQSGISGSGLTPGTDKGTFGFTPDGITQAEVFTDKYTQGLSGLIDMNFVANDSFSQLALGISGTMDAMQQGAPSAIAASKKMAGAFVKDKKKLAIISMVMELAAAAASFAVSDFRGGALHLQSAGLYGAAAAFQFASSAAGGGGGGNAQSSLPARNRASRGSSSDAPVIQMTNNFNVPAVGDSEFGRFVISSANRAARMTGDQFDTRVIGENMMTGT